MDIYSQLKLTFRGVVLLDFGERMERLPEISATGLAQAVDFAGATLGRVFGRGNERGAVSWGRFKSWESHAEATGMGIALRRLVSLGVAGTLEIEVENGATFELRDFVMTDLRAEPAELPGFHTRESFTGQGGELVITDRAGLGGDEMGNDPRLIGDATKTATMSAEKI